MRKRLFFISAAFFIFFACTKKFSPPEEPVVSRGETEEIIDVTFPDGYDIRLGDSVYRPPTGLVTDSVGTIIGDSIYTKISGLRLRSVTVELDTTAKYGDITLWFNDRIVDTFKRQMKGTVVFENLDLECKKGSNRFHIKTRTRGKSGQWFYVTMPENSITITDKNGTVKPVHGLPIQNKLKIK